MRPRLVVALPWWLALPLWLAWLCIAWCIAVLMLAVYVVLAILHVVTTNKETPCSHADS